MLKASEDKTYPGAIVASLASPWGQSVPAGVTSGGEPSYFGSYREVFARDLYEAFTGLMADGDIGTARAATLFLFDRQQLPDGAMPRNSLLNGKAAPDTGGTQLDEAAYPILMAYLAGLGGDATLWQDHIRPAADFLVANGPVVRRGALGGADRLLAVHDRGRDRRADRRVGHRREPRRHGAGAAVPGHRRRLPAEHQVLDGDDHRPGRARATSSGCPRPATRTRRSATASATAARPWTSAAVLDGGFQELVRLGELPVTDPDVQASLAVLDKHISVSTPSGTGYYRYGNVGRQGQRGRVRRLLPAEPDLVHGPWGTVGADRYRHRAPVAEPVR